MNKDRIAIVALSCLLVIVVIALLWSSYNDKLQNAYDTGVQYGVNRALAQIIIETQNCQVLPLTVPVENGSVTINLADVECIKKVIEGA